MSLLAVAAALVLVLAWQMLAPVAPIAVDAANAATRPQTALTVPVYQPPPEASFAVINARAAFNPSRQPVAEPPQSGMTTAASPPDVTLVGVAIGAGKSIALLKPADGSAAISAAVGQIVQGWQLTRVDADGVVFHANGADYSVKLRAAAGLNPVPRAPRNLRTQQPVPGQ
jgi:type II secretory pathway component PulC